MKFILVITDIRRKDTLFISDYLKVFSIKDAILSVKNGLVANTIVVNGRFGSYIRTIPKAHKEDEFETISLSAPSFFKLLHNNSLAHFTPALKKCIDIYLQNNLDQKYYIEPVGSYQVSIAKVKEKVLENKDYIASAARYFSINENLLGAILIDEISQAGAFEFILDAIGGNLIGVNTSAGVAQIKLNTAHNLIIKELYNPDKSNKKLLSKLNMSTRRELYDYVKLPKHSIYFAAANIRYFIDSWKSEIDLSNRIEILATLYHLPYRKPHNKPRENERGLQIAGEFYNYFKEWTK